MKPRPAPLFKMRSRFPGVCLRCHKAIPSGTWVLWRHGEGACHPMCLPVMPAGERERLAQASLRQMRGTPELLAPTGPHSPEIQAALDRSGGNVIKAAGILGMSLEGLQKRLIFDKCNRKKV